MDDYLILLRKKGFGEEVIKLVEKVTFIAEEYVSTPKSTKILSEVIIVVNQTYDVKDDN